MVPWLPPPSFSKTLSVSPLHMEVINTAKQFSGEATKTKTTKNKVRYSLPKGGTVEGDLYVPKADAEGVEGWTITATPIKA